MSNNSLSFDTSNLKVIVEEETEEYSFGKLFRVVKAVLRYSKFGGGLSEPIVRLNFERGESVAILLYDPKQDAVVLVRQFRYPVYAALGAQEKRSLPERAWLLEIVAGIKEPGRDVAEVANHELLEEAGYEVKGELRKIATIYPSPGGTSERITLFLAIADSWNPAGKGGGIVAEGEDTQAVVLPFAQALAMVDRGEIQDAKTLVALQHLARIDRASLRPGTAVP
jgi:ADP-ribose pyrophosphatase